MMDELMIEIDGHRYLGHLWASPATVGEVAPLRWRFAQRGQVVAEFPATVYDTPEVVQSRLRRVLERSVRSAPAEIPPGPQGHQPEVA